MTTTAPLKLTGLTGFQIKALQDEGYSLQGVTKSTAILVAAPDGAALAGWQEAKTSLDSAYRTFQAGNGTYHRRIEQWAEDRGLNPRSAVQSARRGHLTALASVRRRVAGLAATTESEQ